MLSNGLSGSDVAQPFFVPGGFWMISRQFISAIKLSPKRAYRIAQEAGIHPSALSKIINGIERARPNDPRVLAVAAVMGLDARECFAEEESLIEV